MGRKSYLVRRLILNSPILRLITIKEATTRRFLYYLRNISMFLIKFASSKAMDHAFIYSFIK